jgi:hypothetical protein
MSKTQASMPHQCLLKVRNSQHGTKGKHLRAGETETSQLVMLRARTVPNETMGEHLSTAADASQLKSTWSQLPDRLTQCRDFWTG